MPFMRSAFARLLEPLDRRVIARIVAAHGGDHGVGAGASAWTCERHLKALLFAQFCGLTSLRQIVEALGSQSASFYHLNLRAPCRSTLADANRARPWAVFRDLAAALLSVAAGALRREGEDLIRLLDATPLPLTDARFAWAEAGARTRGLKLHLLYDPRHSRPVWFAVTGAKTEDVVAGRAAPLEPGASYVFDKAYTDGNYRVDSLGVSGVVRSFGAQIEARKGNMEGEKPKPQQEDDKKLPRELPDRDPERFRRDPDDLKKNGTVTETISNMPDATRERTAHLTLEIFSKARSR